MPANDSRDGNPLVAEPAAAERAIHSEAPAPVAAALLDWQRMGDETKAILYPDPRLRESLDHFFLIGKKMAENPNPSGTAFVASIGGQGALLVTNPASGVATVIGGGVLSKALNSPKVTRLLTEAMQTPKTAPAAKSLTVRLRALLKNYGPATATALGASQTQRAQATP